MPRAIQGTRTLGSLGGFVVWGLGFRVYGLTKTYVRMLSSSYMHLCFTKKALLENMDIFMAMYLLMNSGATGFVNYVNGLGPPAQPGQQLAVNNNAVNRNPRGRVAGKDSCHFQGMSFRWMCTVYVDGLRAMELGGRGKGPQTPSPYPPPGAQTLSPKNPETLSPKPKALSPRLRFQGPWD